VLALLEPQEQLQLLAQQLLLLLRQVLALLEPQEQLGLQFPPPLLEQLEPSLLPLEQLEMLDQLLVEVKVELDLLLLRCWSSYAAKSEKEKSEVLCVYI